PSGSTHEIALVAIDRFAAALEGAASDELLLTTTGPVLEATARELSTIAGVEFEPHPAEEADASQISELIGDGDVVVYPVLDGTDAVACLVLAVGAVDASVASGSGSAPQARAGSDNDEMVTLAIGAPLVLADVE